MKLELEKAGLYKISLASGLLLDFFHIMDIDEYFVLKTDGRNLYVGNRFWDYDLVGRVFLLYHECLHVFLRHTERVKYWRGDFRAFNIGADAKVNYLIMSEFNNARKYLVDWTIKFGEDNVRRLSAEQLARMVDKSFKFEEDKFDEVDVLKGSTIDDAFLKTLLNIEGVFMKGKGSVDRLLQRSSSVEFIRDLEKWIDTYWYDYNKWNRKYDDFGDYEVDDVYKVAFVDVSASISDMELSLFVSEVSRLGFDEVVFFDNGKQLEVKGDSIPRSVKGKGGTRFAGVLRQYLPKLNNDAIMVLFTDGYIGDSREVVHLLSRIKAKKVLVTVDKQLNGFDEVISLTGYDI